jgi:16S rRNA (guanine527-N7)-methyltransferase
VTLSEDRIAQLLEPYLPGDFPAPANLFAQLSTYLDLLLRWNARTNLTSIREPEGIVRRHFGESLFTGVHLVPLIAPTASLLDFGSGAGFPGLPIQLLLPGIQVTLAESQGKKVAFLREAVRTLGVTTEVWGGRVDAMPPARAFDVVALRAVDNMEKALEEAALRVAPGGVLAVLGGKTLPGHGVHVEGLPLPSSQDTYLYLKV